MSSRSCPLTRHPMLQSRSESFRCDKIESKPWLLETESYRWSSLHLKASGWLFHQGICLLRWKSNRETKASWASWWKSRKFCKNVDQFQSNSDLTNQFKPDKPFNGFSSINQVFDAVNRRNLCVSREKFSFAFHPDSELRTIKNRFQRPKTKKTSLQRTKPVKLQQ
jgi:hypothetical protein